MTLPHRRSRRRCFAPRGQQGGAPRWRRPRARPRWRRPRARPRWRRPRARPRVPRNPRRLASKKNHPHTLASRSIDFRACNTPPVARRKRFVARLAPSSPRVKRVDFVVATRRLSPSSPRRRRFADGSSRESPPLAGDGARGRSSRGARARHEGFPRGGDFAAGRDGGGVRGGGGGGGARGGGVSIRSGGRDVRGGDYQTRRRRGGRGDGARRGGRARGVERTRRARRRDGSVDVRTSKRGAGGRTRV